MNDRMRQLVKAIIALLQAWLGDDDSEQDEPTGQARYMILRKNMTFGQMADELPFEAGRSTYENGSWYTDDPPMLPSWDRLVIDFDQRLIWQLFEREGVALAWKSFELGADNHAHPFAGVEIE